MTSDAADRRRAVEEVDRSFVLEASAGTGKTNTLIERVLRLVLVAGPSGPPLRLASVAAITFTEKAAGEMKVRLRQEFERRAAASVPEAERARQALGDLETAAIQTIHAFAVGLLKARPVEAGLDPRFRAIDEAESELLFEEVWEAWLKRAIAERRGPIERALRGGMGLSDLRTLARILARQARAVRDLALDPPPSEAEVAARRAALLKEACEFERRITDRSDKLVPHFRAALQWLRTGPRTCASWSRSRPS
ncbi:MAG: hypothetical protein DMG07_23260 [Acidobacteria bacterium]|nr:MAG: hypothetical protein DMG07_23260 [Acidobacteriota bacterium]